jgi:hypothetical protein
MGGSGCTSVGTTVDVLVGGIDELVIILISVVFGIKVFVTSGALGSASTSVSWGTLDAVATTSKF